MLSGAVTALLQPQFVGNIACVGAWLFGSRLIVGGVSREDTRADKFEMP